MNVERKRLDSAEKSPGRASRCVTRAAVVLAVAALLQPTSKVHASIFGEETAVLSAILAEEIAQVAQMVQTVVNLETQIRQLTAMIEQGDIMLQSFRSPQDLLNSLRYAQRLLRKEAAIQRNIKHLQFKLEAIDNDRKEVFPDMDGVKTDDMHRRAKTWNAALKESSQVAMRAQTSVESIQARLDYSDQLQSHSDNTPGIVGQLQLVNKALGLLHTDLAAIEANLAYGQRVTATMAGVQAADTDRADEEARRMMVNYTEVGPPPRVLTELP